MKNYEQLMAKISRALKPGGKLLVHIFAHKNTPYDYEEGWMTTYFFTGGTSMYLTETILNPHIARRMVLLTWLVSNSAVSGSTVVFPERPSH